MTTEEEIRYFEGFKNLFSQLNNGDAIHYGAKNEWPDVVYKTQDDQIIAFELTELLTKENIEKTVSRTQDRLENHIENKTVDLLNKSFLPKKLHVEVILNQQNQINNNDEADHISQIIASEVINELGTHKFNNFEKIIVDSPELGAKKVDRINILYSPKINQITIDVWSNGEWIPKIEEEEIVQIIANKNKKIIANSQYKFDEAWLLIVETEFASTWRENFNSLSSQVFDADYERVFIYKFLFQDFLELKTRKRTAHNHLRNADH